MIFKSLNNYGLKKKFSQVVVVKLLGVALGFLVTIVIARVIGAAQLGVYTYAFTVVMVAGVFCRLGFDNLIIRQISSLRLEGKYYYIKSLVHSALVVSTGLSVFAGLVSAFYLTYYVDDENPYRYALLIGLGFVLPFLSIAYTQRAILNGLKLAALSEAPITVVRHLFVMIIVIVLSFMGFGFDAEKMMLLTALAFFIIIVLGHILISKSFSMKYQASKASLDLVMWGRRSLPYFIISAANVLNQRLDILFLGFFSTPLQVGVYAVVSRLLPIISFASRVVSTTLKPHISELYSARKFSSLQGIIFSTSIAVFGFTAGVCLMLGLFGSQILSFFGAEFVDGYPIMLILLVGAVATVLAGPVTIVLSMCEEQKLLSSVELISNLSYAMLLLLLVVPFGALGAATATSIVWISRSFILFYFVRSRLRLNTSVFNLESWRIVLKRGAE